MRRPDWWPPSLWPVNRSERVERGPTEGTPRATGSGGEGTPVETFLRAFVVSSGADRAVMVRLDPNEETWTVEAVVDDEGPNPASIGQRTPAPGHPLTWCLREDLLVQLRAEELMPGAEGGGWALAGPVPGSRRVLAVRYGAGPPIRAREALGAALAHLAVLEGAGLLDGPGGEREPLSGPPGRQ